MLLSTSSLIGSSTKDVPTSAAPDGTPISEEDAVELFFGEVALEGPTLLVGLGRPDGLMQGIAWWVLGVRGLDRRTDDEPVAGVEPEVLDKVRVGDEVGVAILEVDLGSFTTRKSLRLITCRSRISR